MWFGREHLPRVAWLLAGGQGPPPDVANRSFGTVSASVALDRAPLTVLLDLRNPFSYLALRPVAELAHALRIGIDWLPLTVPPLRPPSEPAPGDDRGILHRRQRARALAREVEIYARAQGLVLREIYRDADASAFTLGWLWLREQRGAGLEGEGFRAYWSLELDPSSIPAVSPLVARAGGDAAAFEAWCARDGPELAAGVAETLRQRGVKAVPGYLVDGEFFAGRQHLPMIRWILGGRKGPGPI